MTATSNARTYRPFAVTVARRVQSGPHFVRVTLTGDDLDQCGDTCLDQRVKLVFTSPGSCDGVRDRFAEPEFDWYAWWLARDDGARPPMRTYTLRSVRQDVREVDIDFACHGDNGPGSRFALTAEPGDELVLVGPDRGVPESREQGLAWRPGAATDVLIAGDETAVPAICAILESLPAGVRGHAFLEVEHPGDVQPVQTASAVEVCWLPRGELAVGSALTEAVHAWTGRPRFRSGDDDVPVAEDDLLWEEAEAGAQGAPYVWLAGEAGATTALRRHLATEAGLDKKRMSFMGYWKLGRAAAG